MPINSPEQYFLTQGIDVENITYGYPSSTQYILRNLSTRIPSQCITAIVGSNGSGKSTFMRSVFGLHKIQCGSIKVLGIDPQAEFRKTIKICSYVCQQPTADFEMTGLEILNYFGSMHGITKITREKKIRDLIRLFHLEQIILNKVGSYSGGNLQKIHLAIGLINSPQVLMLDEPTNNLDAISKYEIWEYLQRRSQRERKTSIVISHDLDCVEKHADHLIVMDSGKIRYQGGIRDFIKNANNQPINHRSQENIHIEEAHASHCQSSHPKNPIIRVSNDREKSSSIQSLSCTSLFDALCKITDFNYHCSTTMQRQRRGGRRSRG